ncbi:hypothetical protein E4U14_008116 [Claviceps sp. LM454 group G7]|nr:hypothetical protein E4U14_008116 [Claviceps sp. LM454 group G7]
MKFLLPLFCLTALSTALPTWHQGPIMSDDDTLMERRDLYRVEIVHSAFPNTIITKVTKVASNARSYLAASFKGAVADSNGDVMTILYSKKNPIPIAIGRITRHGHRGRHNRHRISLLGFRNRLALFLLAFAVVLTVAGSYLRKLYVASSRRTSDQINSEAAFPEKGSLGDVKKDGTMES